MTTAVAIAYSLQPFLFYWLIKRPALNGRAPVTMYNLLHAEFYKEKKGFFYFHTVAALYPSKAPGVYLRVVFE
jgi:hypothetical protein